MLQTAQEANSKRLEDASITNVGLSNQVASMTSEVADARQVRDASVPAAGRAGMNCDAWCITASAFEQALESVLRFLELFHWLQCVGCYDAVACWTVVACWSVVACHCIVIPVLTLVLPGVV